MTSVSRGYVVSFGATKDTLVWPGAGDEFFVEAMRPGYEGFRDIEQAGMHIGMKTGGKKVEDTELSIRLSPEAAFIEKCKVQVVGYRVPARMEDGEEVVLTYDREERKNVDLYKRWAHPGNRVPLTVLVDDARPDETISLRSYIEGFLDMVAGIDTPSAADYEALKNGRRP